MGVSLLLERDRAVGTLGIATDSETYQPLYDEIVEKAHELT